MLSSALHCFSLMISHYWVKTQLPKVNALDHMKGPMSYPRKITVFYRWVRQLSRFLFPPRSVNGYRNTVRKAWKTALGILGSTIPFRRSNLVQAGRNRAAPEVMDHFVLKMCFKSKNYFGVFSIHTMKTLDNESHETLTILCLKTPCGVSPPCSNESCHFDTATGIHSDICQTRFNKN